MSGFWISVLTESCIFSIMALGLNVVWGWAGDFDLAFYGYVALSVYMTLVFTIGKPLPPVQYIIGAHLPWPLAVLLGIVITAALAALIGSVALRNLRAIYFAITTLGAISVLYVIVQVYTPLFNGFNGIAGLFDPLGGPLHLGYTSYHYFLLGLCAVVLLIAAVVLSVLSTTPYGRALRSIRDDEDAASAFGRSVYAAKLKAYLLGAVLAGIGGGLFAAYLGAFNPSAWSPVEVLTLYAGVLVGGRGNVRGVILGTFVLYLGFIEMTRNLPEIPGNPAFAPALREVLVGALIILFLKFRPQGLVPEPLGYDGQRPRMTFRTWLNGRRAVPIATSGSEPPGAVSTESSLGTERAR